MVKALPAELERVRLNLKNSLLSSDVSLDQFCKQAGVRKLCVQNFCDGISKPQARILERILKEMTGLGWIDLAQTEMPLEEVKIEAVDQLEELIRVEFGEETCLLTIRADHKRFKIAFDRKLTLDHVGHIISYLAQFQEPK